MCLLDCCASRLPACLPQCVYWTVGLPSTCLPASMCLLDCCASRLPVCLPQCVYWTVVLAVYLFACLNVFTGLLACRLGPSTCLPASMCLLDCCASRLPVCLPQCVYWTVVLAVYLFACLNVFTGLLACRLGPSTCLPASMCLLDCCASRLPVCLPQCVYWTVVLAVYLFACLNVFTGLLACRLGPSTCLPASMCLLDCCASRLPVCLPQCVYWTVGLPSWAVCLLACLNVFTGLLC